MCWNWTVYFLNKITREIYKKYSVEKILPCHLLTDTDSTCLFFVSICKHECEVPDKKFINCIFEIMTENEVSSRFNALDEFWERSGVRDKAFQKKLGYYKIEHIDDPFLATVAVNPKEYPEYFESGNVSKKHKGLKKRLRGHWVRKTTQIE